MLPPSGTAGLVEQLAVGLAKDLTSFQTENDGRDGNSNMCKREGGRWREQEPITHGVSSPSGVTGRVQKERSRY